MRDTVHRLTPSEMESMERATAEVHAEFDKLLEVTESDAMTVVETPAGWGIDSGGKMIAGPFKTNAEAWKWLDERDSQSSEMDERKRRIGNAFADR